MKLKSTSNMACHSAARLGLSKKHYFKKRNHRTDGQDSLHSLVNCPLYLPTFVVKSLGNQLVLGWLSCMWYTRQILTMWDQDAVLWAQGALSMSIIYRRPAEPSCGGIWAGVSLSMLLIPMSILHVFWSRLVPHVGCDRVLRRNSKNNLLGLMILDLWWLFWKVGFLCYVLLPF